MIKNKRLSVDYFAVTDWKPLRSIKKVRHFAVSYLELDGKLLIAYSVNQNKRVWDVMHPLDAQKSHFLWNYSGAVRAYRHKILNIYSLFKEQMITEIARLEALRHDTFVMTGKDDEDLQKLLDHHHHILECYFADESESKIDFYQI